VTAAPGLSIPQEDDVVTDRNPLTAFYQEIRARLAAAAGRCGWPALEAEVERHLTAVELPPTLLLPIASAAAAGGDPARAVTAAAACGFLVASFRWFDDVQDRDRDDALWARLGTGRATNLAAAALTLAWRALAEDEATPRSALAAFGDYTVELARGQDRDLAGRAASLDDGLRTIEEKSGAAMALACRLGVLAALDDQGRAEPCARFGRHLGTTVQLLDDLDGAFHPYGLGDLATGKVTMAVLYGLTADHSARAELRAIVDGGRLAAEAGRVRAILEVIDTREFLLWSALEERRRALAALAELPRFPGETAAAGRDALSALADGAVADGEALLARPEAPPPVETNGIRRGYFERRPTREAEEGR
jgi:geranylgeranyl diphosphate synthase type I